MELVGTYNGMMAELAQENRKAEEKEYKKGERKLAEIKLREAVNRAEDPGYGAYIVPDKNMYEEAEFMVYNEDGIQAADKTIKNINGIGMGFVDRIKEAERGTEKIFETVLSAEFYQEQLPAMFSESKELFEEFLATEPTIADVAKILGGVGILTRVYIYRQIWMVILFL